MSGNNNNIQKSKSPRPIAIAPAPEKPTTSQPSSSASTSTTVGGNGGSGNELNGKRKLAPRPPPSTTTVEESVKPLFKIQPKKDSPPTTINNSNNISSSNGSSSQQKASTPTPSTGQMMTGSFVLRPVSNPNQRMYPFYSSPSAHPHLQQRLQATIDSNGNIIPNSSLTENQLHQLQQQHQRIITLQQQQQHQQQQRPTAPIPIAPRPTSISSAPSTSEASSSSTSVAAAASTPSTSNSKPPKIYPRPIEKKPTTSNPSASSAPMNIIPPQNIIPTPQLNTGGAIIHFSPNGTPFGYTPHPSAAALNVHLQNQQLSYIQPQGLTRMQMSQINPMSIFPHHPHQQIIHPAYLNAAAAAANGNATYISQGIQNSPQMAQFTISGFNPNQIPTSFMNSLNSQQQQQQQQQFHLQQQQHLHRQHQQQQQNQQRKLIPITAIPSTSIITTLPSTSSSAATSNPPTLMPRPPPLLPATIPIAPAPIAPEIKLESKIQESTSDDDENEPPPLLDRDETVPASVHEAFVQEAAGVRMQFPAIGTAGNEPLRHFIDGFIIEESSVPFEIDDNIKDPMEFIRQIAKEQKLKKQKEEAAAAMEVEKEDVKKDIVKKVKKEKPEKVDKVLKKRGRRSNMEKKNSISSQKSNGNGKNKQKSASPSKSKKHRSSSSTEHQKQQRRPSPTESIKSPNSERPGSSKGTRKSREIENLIKMDFGPKNQVFKTTSVDEYTKAIKRGQQTSLRPVILQDYKERSPEISREGDEQQCLNCKFTFAQLKLRCEKYPQYCTKECRRKFRKSAREAREQQADAKSADPSSSSSASNNNNIINEMTAALIGKSSENSYKEIRKRLSNESEASTISHIPTKSSPLKLRIRSSSDLESPASSSQILSPAPSTSAAAFQMMMMPGPSSTPTTMIQNINNTSNGSIPSIASPPPNGNAPTLSSAAATNSNFQLFSRITEELGLNPSDVNSWSAEDVGRWINRITNSQTNGDIFISEEIDGSSLFMLSQNQITTELKVKLGPTLKIVNAIDWLRNF